MSILRAPLTREQHMKRANAKRKRNFEKSLIAARAPRRREGAGAIRVYLESVTRITATPCAQGNRYPYLFIETLVTLVFLVGDFTQTRFAATRPNVTNVTSVIRITAVPSRTYPHIECSALRGLHASRALRASLHSESSGREAAKRRSGGADGGRAR